MTFKEATDALGLKVTHEDMARVLGCSVQLVRQARLDPDLPWHRTPPEGWEAKLAELARARGEDLADLAEELEDG